MHQGMVGPDQRDRRCRERTRRATIVAVCAVALSLAGACGDETGDGPSGGSAVSSPSAAVSTLPVEFPDRYVNERFGFSVKYDAELFELTEEPGEDGAEAVVMESDGGAVGPAAAVLMVVGPLESESSGEAGAPDTMLSLKGNLPRLARRFGVTLEGGVEDATVGGLPGVTAEISGPLPVSLEGEGLYGRMSMTAWEGNAMIVIEGAAKDDWPQASGTTLTRVRLQIDTASQ